MVKNTFGKLKKSTRNTVSKANNLVSEKEKDNFISQPSSSLSPPEPELKTIKKTGLIVRLNLYELYIKDPYYDDEVYAPFSKKQAKNPNFVLYFRIPSAMVAIVGHDLHQFWHGLLSNLFSKQSVLEILLKL